MDKETKKSALDKIELEGIDPFLEVAKGQLVFKEHGVILSKDGTEIKLIPDRIEGEFKIPETVTRLDGDVFKRCKKITNVRIPGSVISIDKDVFSGCEKLERIEVAEENPAYKSINGMLLNKEGTKIIFVPAGIKGGDITIPEGVTEIGAAAFSDCIGLTSITIPKSVTVIGKYAFDDCTGLRCITIPESATAIDEGAFYGCIGLTSITIPEGVTEIGVAAFYGCTGLTSITIPKSVVEIGKFAFCGCRGLTCVTIPESVTEIRLKSFAECSSLTSIAIPESVTKIESVAFADCTGLTSITIPKGVVEIGGFAFCGCRGLTCVTIPQSVTNIGGGAFYGCTRLVDIEVAEENPAYKSINGMLLNKEGTKLIYVPAGLKGSLHIPDGVTIIGVYAFVGCTGLTSITIPKSVREIPSISGRTSISLYKERINTLRSADTETDKELGDIRGFVSHSEVFSGCTELECIEVTKENTVYKSVNGFLLNKEGTAILRVPEGIKGEFKIPESVIEIESGAFSGCTGLISITIPKSVTEIGGDAFDGCILLKEIYFDGDAPSLLNSFEGASATICYRKGAKGWGETFGGLPTREIDE